MHLQADTTQERELWIACLLELREEEIRQQNRAMVKSDLLANELFANVKACTSI